MTDTPQPEPHCICELPYMGTQVAGTPPKCERCGLLVAQPAPELLRKDELSHAYTQYWELATLLQSRLREARANLHDAEGRYEACYAELTKVQSRNKELVEELVKIANGDCWCGDDHEPRCPMHIAAKALAKNGGGQ